MEILYVLIPVSVVLVLAILAVLGWAVNSGQFEDVDQEALRILQAGDHNLQDNVERHQD
jgi:cbb3-type cytochrome oxidase maturation protein